MHDARLLVTLDGDKWDPANAVKGQLWYRILLAYLFAPFNSSPPIGTH